MKPPPSPSIEPHLFYKRRSGVATGDHNNIANDDDTTPPDGGPSTTNEALEKILQEMRDLQKTRAQDEEEQRYKDLEENQMRNDWMLAAAVVDRIFAIIFAITFIGGTITVVVFA